MSRFISIYVLTVLFLSAGASGAGDAIVSIIGGTVGQEVEPEPDGVARHSGLARVYITKAGNLFVEFAENEAVTDPWNYDASFTIRIDVGDAAALQVIDVDGVLQLIHDADTLIEPTEDAIFADFGSVDVEIAGDGSLIYVVLQQGVVSGQRFEALVQRQDDEVAPSQDREARTEPHQAAAPDPAKCKTKKCQLVCDGAVSIDCGCIWFLFCWCHCDFPDPFFDSAVATFGVPMKPISPGGSIL